jgi:hypothetical protein
MLVHQSTLTGVLFFCPPLCVGQKESESNALSFRVLHNKDHEYGPLHPRTVKDVSRRAGTDLIGNGSWTVVQWTVAVQSEFSELASKWPLSAK